MTLGAFLHRYDLITNYRAGSSIEEMEPSDDGEWVRFEQVLTLLASLSQELERIRTEHKELLSRVDSLRLLEGTGSTASTERR
jgi:hypothetical protein